jgi:hypothetical protein
MIECEGIPDSLASRTCSMGAVASCIESKAVHSDSKLAPPQCHWHPQQLYSQQSSLQLLLPCVFRGSAGYDKYGYDKYGYNKDGYHKEGYHKVRPLT